MGMVKKPRVCVVDENVGVKAGWEQSLGHQATLHFFRDYEQLLEHAKADASFLPALQCVILGKLYPHLPVPDLLATDCLERLRMIAKVPLFLNWQGYVPKEELERRFDGKIFHRYGVKWHTLRLRIQRLSSKKDVSLRPMSVRQPGKKFRQLSKMQRCQELLKAMATKANGAHRDRIHFYAFHDHENGIALLEALYNRLITHKERPEGCPSRYINSSPVIAAKILQETLHREGA